MKMLWSELEHSTPQTHCLHPLEAISSVLGEKSKILYDFLELHLRLPLPGRRIALLLVVLHLPVVEDFAHRGVGVGCNLDQVEPLFSGTGQGVFGHELPELGSIVVDQENATHADALVVAGFVVVWLALETRSSTTQGRLLWGLMSWTAGS